MNEGERALHEACENGDVSSCIALLREGVDVNATDCKFLTPLMKAVICHQVDVVNTLMHKREELHVRVYDFDSQGFSAFHWAVMLGFVDIVSIMTFLDRSLLNRPDQSGRTPLFLCCIFKPQPLVVNFIKSWYPADYKLLTELIYSETLKGTKRKRKKRSEWSLRWIVGNVIPIFSKRSSYVQKVPVFCFVSTLCLSSLCSLLFMTSFHFSQGLLLLDASGHLCIWIFFYKICSATPLPISTDLYEQFESAIKRRAAIDMKSSNDSPPLVCYQCRIQQTTGIGHCAYLNKCVANYDHFCLFVWSSIHSTNYMFFLLYLLSMFFTIPVFMYMLYEFTLHDRTLERGQHPLSDNVAHQVIPHIRVKAAVILLLWVALMWLLVASLVVYNVQSILRGQTSRQRSKREAYTAATSMEAFLKNLQKLSEDIFASHRGGSVISEKSDLAAVHVKHV